jgi:hypothetical protein
LRKEEIKIEAKNVETDKQVKINGIFGLENDIIYDVDIDEDHEEEE